MKYLNIQKAIFIERPNRFIARVLINGNEEMVHVRNTGRCKELLIKGVKVILEESTNPKRKTKYSIISVYKGDNLVNIDSQVPNKVVFDALVENKISELSNLKNIARERTYRNSRFDIGFEKGYIEIKGVTLERDRIGYFPDAPTTRGYKHVDELIKAKNDGYISVLFFLIQMQGVEKMTVNWQTDAKFSQIVQEAREQGITVLVYDSIISENSIVIGKKIPFFINKSIVL